MDAPWLPQRAPGSRTRSAGLFLDQKALKLRLCTLPDQAMTRREAERSEILARGRIIRQNFQHRAVGERLQSLARLENGKRAFEIDHIERGGNDRSVGHEEAILLRVSRCKIGCTRRGRNGPTASSGADCRTLDPCKARCDGDAGLGCDSRAPRRTAGAGNDR